MQHDYRITILFALFVIFSGLASVLFFRSFSKKMLMTFLGSLLLIASVVCMYLIFGGFGDYYAFEADKSSKMQAAKMLKDIKSPDELISRLVKHLTSNPDSARGWYLLGRLYVSQKNSQDALRAFVKAYNLDSNDEAIVVNYASMLLENGYEAKGQSLLENMLVKDPKQKDALVILAMHAYRQKKINVAVAYWQRLLQLLPEQSADADAIRLAIANAYAKK